MNMHQYLINVKQSDFKYEKDGYSYKIIANGKVVKQLPQKDGNRYYKIFSKRFLVYTDASIIDKEIQDVKIFTIIIQLLLICFFALISYFLTKRSIKPMIDTISHLDRFVGDLIHDLNTPITSILLNTKMLQKDATEDNNKKITRIENSAKNILSLYSNLEILLDENSLKKQKLKLVDEVSSVLDIYKPIYPQVTINLDIDTTDIINTNQNAFRRILDNIISNAYKYSIDVNPTIDIGYSNGILTIKDNGKGIKYPKKIFERNYKEAESGHGIGMHIVYRLCSELSIDINIQSQDGTCITLTF